VFVLGHLGIGSRLAGRLPGVLRAPGWLALGTLLPDLIDKPLYYALSLPTGLHGAELGLISGTRTFGHTALFGLALFAGLTVRGHRLAGRALLAGLATHWLLDCGGEPAGALLLRLGLVEPSPPGPGPGTLAAILFPLLGPHFPIAPFKSATAHFATLRNLYTVFGELLGGFFLWRACWPRRSRWRELFTTAAPPPRAPDR
jgi:hypothetical protein